MEFKLITWLKIALNNLLIVAVLGLLMRYKIGFEFPFLDQKHIQHSHSHFAFVGWVSHMLTILMIAFLDKKLVSNKEKNLKKYHLLLIANLICAYGMLVFFMIQGYGFISIFFSTASIFISWIFAYYYYKDLKLIANTDLSKNWFKAALFFNCISALGTFALAYMMATKNIHQNEYLASIYYYLHFQYNGWFFFACMGLFFYFFQIKATENPFYKFTFWLFFVSCIPAYFLSTLWLKLSLFLFVLTIIASFVQVIAWFKFLFLVKKYKHSYIHQLPIYLKFILGFVASAVSIKLLLQLASTFPALSQLAFGFRPIVIAYLHLVLLAIITLFLLFYMFSNQLIPINRKMKIGFLIFTLGIFLNEIFLGIQGIASLSYIGIPFINEMLFGAAIVLVIGIGLMFVYSLKKR